jgi:virginiamycin B lyase
MPVALARLRRDDHPHADRYTEEITLPQNSDPMFIAAGPDGAMWFTLEGSSQIGRADIATRAVTYYEIPAPSALPWDITAGPDGAMWFTELGGRHIGRIAMDGTITEYPVPGTYGGVTGITPGFDGTLWVIQADLQEVDQMSTRGRLLRAVATDEQPNHITAGPDGTCGSRRSPPRRTPSSASLRGPRAALR